MMTASERAPWQSPRILTTLLLVFLAGGTAGALSMRLGLHEKLHHTVSAATRQQQPSREMVLQKFKTELDLTSMQTDGIAMVLDDYGMYYQSLQDQLDDLRSTGKTRILQILNQEQRAKFQKMMSDLAPQLAPASKPQ